VRHILRSLFELILARLAFRNLARFARLQSVGIVAALSPVNIVSQRLCLCSYSSSTSCCPLGPVAGAPQRVKLNASMQDDVAATPKAPGQHALHYSPRTPLSLFKDRKSLVAACADLDKADVSCAALLIGDNELPSCQVIILPAEPEKVAEQLYDSLHRLDAMKLGRLLVELPPNTPEWAAVLDRLSRAGHQ